jgi:hypothetical protein
MNEKNSNNLHFSSFVYPFTQFLREVEFISFAVGVGSFIFVI